MKLYVVAVGKPRGVVSDAIAEYESRARRYWKLETVEVASGAGGARDAETVVAAEGERLLARLPQGVDVVALTREGPQTRSESFARLLGGAARDARSLAFVIGGAFGLAEEVRSAGRTLSLSAMTLPHDLARLLLAEQIYRAGTILRGEPYHKGS